MHPIIRSLIITLAYLKYIRVDDCVRAAGTVQMRHHVPAKGHLKEQERVSVSKILTLPSLMICLPQKKGTPEYF